MAAVVKGHARTDITHVVRKDDVRAVRRTGHVHLQAQLAADQVAGLAAARAGGQDGVARLHKVEVRTDMPGERARVRLDAPVLQDLEIIVGRHEALQLDTVPGQLHHADPVTVSVCLVHTHADKRQFPVCVLGVDARALRLHHKARLFQHVLVTVKDGGRYLHQTLRLLEKRPVAVREALHLVSGKNQHVQVDVSGKGQLEITGTVPEATARVLYIAVRDIQFLLHLQAVEIGKTGLVNIHELDSQSPFGCAAVKEGKVHRHGLLLPVTVHRHGGDAFQVRAFLEDILVTDAHHRPPVIHRHARPVSLPGQHVVRPDPTVTGKEEHRLVLRVPFLQAVVKGGVVQVALLRGEVVPKGGHRAGDASLHDLELGLDILAGH